MMLSLKIVYILLRLFFMVMPVGLVNDYAGVCVLWLLSLLLSSFIRTFFAGVYICIC